MGALYTKAKLIPDGVFLTAARALTETVSAEDLAHGSLFPSLTEVRSVSRHIAQRVAEYCLDSGIAQIEKPADLTGALEEYMYKPKYID